MSAKNVTAYPSLRGCDAAQGIAMNPVARRHLWPYVLLAAGVLVLVVVASSHYQHDRPGESTAGAGAGADGGEPRAQHVAQRQTALRQIASKRAAAEQPRREGARAGIGRLLELERTPEEDQVLWIAEEDLVVACMRDRGFTYLPNPIDDDSAPDPQQSRVNQAAESARNTGYGLAVSIAKGETRKEMVDVNAESLSRMSPDLRNAFLEALRGPSISPADPGMRHLVESVPLPGGGAAYWYRDSCLAHARDQLYGDDYEYNELGYTDAILHKEMLADADADPEYRTSVDAWRTCMRRRGFDEELPRTAANRLANDYHQKKLSLDELRAQELSIATADAECSAQADIDRIRREAKSRAEDRLVAKHREELLAMRQTRDEALARAESVLGETEP